MMNFTKRYIYLSIYSSHMVCLVISGSASLDLVLKTIVMRTLYLL